MTELTTDVLIVGGGPVGLTASILLADLGVTSIVVERRDGNSKLPKAHYLNCRTMEIFDQIGIAQEIYAAGAPLEAVGAITWYTSLGGDEPSDQQLVMAVDTFGGGELRERYERDSACRSGNLPQKHLEPRLRRLAEERNPGHVLFEHELLALEQDDEGVTAIVRSAAGELQIRSEYVIGADGGRTVGETVGIALDGLPPFGHAVAIHFAADLSSGIQEDRSVIRLINRAAPDGTMVQMALVAMGPTSWDRHCEQWVLNVIAPVGHPIAETQWTDETAAAVVRDSLKLPELELEMISIGSWAIESVLANRYRMGRVFVAGDAAHRHPPTAGIGLNSGIGDAHNLAWKLAAVLDGRAGEQLLDSYETERRPVAARNIEWAMLCAFNHLTTTQAAWAMLPGALPEQNLAAFQAAFAPTPDGATRRARLRELLATLRMEWQHHDIEIGYEYYAGGAVLQDGSEPPPRDPLGLEHVPTARPGHRAPHAWFVRAGERTSTHQLMRPGSFLLLTAADGGAWAQAAPPAAAELGLVVNVLSVGEDLVDIDDVWPALCGHDGGGAVLIRPDGHVAMRACSTPEDHHLVLRQALATALGKSAVQPTPA